MEPWDPPSEPVDLREEPECTCTPGARASPDCHWHAWKSEPLYPVRPPRDRKGVTRTGYRFGADEDVEEDVKF